MLLSIVKPNKTSSLAIVEARLLRKTVAEALSLGRFMRATIVSISTIMPISSRANVDISTKPTQNMNCAKGVCAPTAKKATLNAGDVAEILASGDLTVMSGNLAQNIVISAPLSWASAQRLTLDSYHSIEFDKPVTITGSGTLTITTNDGGSEGDFSFIGKGHVEFLDVSDSFHRLTINGQAYQLVRSPKGYRKPFKGIPLM